MSHNIIKNVLLYGVPELPYFQSVYRCFPFSFEGRMWDLIVSVPDHCLSFYCSISGVLFVDMDEV